MDKGAREIRDQFGTGAKLGSGLAASFWGALIQLAAVPLYVRWMGVESYGLIGFLLVIQALAQTLDLGLGPAVNREMARRAAVPGRERELSTLVHTLEVIYGSVGLVAGLAVGLASGWIASRWLQTTTLAPELVTQALRLMAVIVALQFPLALYQESLLGLQRQVLLGAFRVVSATTTTGLLLATLGFVSTSPLAFLAVQASCVAGQAMVARILLHRLLPSGERARRFVARQLQQLLRFAAGMAGIVISGIVLIQMDKLVLSRLLPLDSFGRYTLAGTLASALYLLITPVFNTFYPTLSALLAAGDSAALARAYHRGCELMALLVLPAAAAMALWPQPVLFVWTGDPVLADRAARVVPFLVGGTALNALMNLPYALQLAAGWTRLALTLNALLVSISVPSLLYLASRFGAPGGAAVWTGLNLLNLMLGGPLTHQRLLPGATSRWLLVDVARPLVSALVAALILRGIVPVPAARIPAAVTLLALLAGIYLAVFLTSPLRHELLRLWRGRLARSAGQGVEPS